MHGVGFRRRDIRTCRLFCVSDWPGNPRVRTLLRLILAVGVRGPSKRAMAQSIRRRSRDANFDLESPGAHVLRYEYCNGE